MLRQKLLAGVLALSVVLTGLSLSGQPVFSKGAAKPAAKTAAPAKQEAAAVAYASVKPAELLKDPQNYLNKKVEFEGTFNSFSSLGLDYKRVMRDSKDYVNVLINRPDVAHHQIPMSELKLFYPRQKSEAVIDLESGDVISVQGAVFNTALGEPWFDIDNIKILKKIPKKDEDGPSPECC